MSKLILAAMGLMLGCGSITGYYLAKWDLQSNAIANSQQSAIAATVSETKAKQVSLKPPPSKRSELELKYYLCTNTKEGSVDFKPINDRTLNDLVHKVCSENS